MALPRRKKTFTMDGAEFVISPLTYDEMEAYGEKLKAFNENLASLKNNSKPQTIKLDDEVPIPVEVRKEMRENAFYVICCGLNNAGAEPLVTSEMLTKEIDDKLAGELVMEILKFNGLEMPSLEEMKRARNRTASAGEIQVSS